MGAVEASMTCTVLALFDGDARLSMASADNASGGCLDLPWPQRGPCIPCCLEHPSAARAALQAPIAGTHSASLLRAALHNTSSFECRMGKA